MTAGKTDLKKSYEGGNNETKS